MNEMTEQMSQRIADYCHISGTEQHELRFLAAKAYLYFSENHYKQKNKYKEISHWNVDQCVHFTIFLQSLAHKAGSHLLSEKIYYFLRTSFCVDVFPTRSLPRRFLLVHPVGSILGNAQFNDYLVVYQNVTVGGSPRLEYPVIGEATVLYAGCKVLGNSRIGKNVIIGAGVTINNEKIPDNTVCYIGDDNVRQFKKNNRSNKESYFI